MEIIIILAFLSASLIFEAFWDAEAFKEGSSNHTWKVLHLISYFTAWDIAGITAVCKVIIIDGWKGSLIIVAIIGAMYILLRFTMFDYILNLRRGKDMDYKTPDAAVKIISLFALIGLIYLYFKL